MAFERVRVFKDDGNLLGVFPFHDLFGLAQRREIHPKTMIEDTETGQQALVMQFPDLAKEIPPPPPNAIGKLIPRNGWALVSYYTGVFGFLAILFFCIPGLFSGGFAIFAGVLGRRDFRRNPELGGGKHAVTGIILGTIQILVVLMGFALIFV